MAWYLSLPAGETHATPEHAPGAVETTPVAATPGADVVEPIGAPPALAAPPTPAPVADPPIAVAPPADPDAIDTGDATMDSTDTEPSRGRRRGGSRPRPEPSNAMNAPAEPAPPVAEMTTPRPSTSIESNPYTR